MRDADIRSAKPHRLDGGRRDATASWGVFDYRCDEPRRVGFPPDRLASTSAAKVEYRASYSVTACYANPSEILKSPKLSRQQKRELLCKWAFDVYRMEVTTGSIPPCSLSRLD